jgi:hypothetical protein
LLASAVLLGLLTGGQPAAVQAAPMGGIYGITPQWGGWCPGPGNQIVWVQYANNTLGKNGGDSGDDIVWIPVNLNVNNNIVMSVRCKYSTPMGMGPYLIKPTRNAQSFWFRLDGTFTKN